MQAFAVLERETLTQFDAGGPTGVGTDFQSRDEITTAFREHRAELEQETVLALVSSFEAAFRIDFLARVKARRKDRISRAFRKLDARSRRRPAVSRWLRLEEILEVWKAETGKSGPIGLFSQLLMYRHWLAHGRYWRQKSGLSLVDALEATSRGYVVFAALRNESSLFDEMATSLMPSP